jgi:bifunctional oligoribonuclease and PAP phosphatase NrnA
MTSPKKTEKTQALRAVADVVRRHAKFLLVTHENPDGDALGSILAASLALETLGKDAVMYLSGTTPLPNEYEFMELDELRRELPGDFTERVVIALDCANRRRVGPDSSFLDQTTLVVDIDHHHDNTHFGAVNLVDGAASSTGEILAALFQELGVGLTPAIAEALYIALVTDTGRFQYTNTTPATLRLAADLVEAGADVHRVFQGVYENVAFAKLKLLARALERARVYEGGRVIVSVLLREDFDDAGAEEPFSEGIIDHLRAVEGADMVALIREPPTQDGPTHRVSLRTTAEDIDVSAVARKSAGGGHRQAAGFSSELPVEEIISFIRSEYLAQANSLRMKSPELIATDI